MLVFFTKSYGILGQVFRVVSSFLRNRQPEVVLNENTLLEYPVSSSVPQGSYYLHFCYYTLMTFLMKFYVIALCSGFTIVNQGEGASYDFLTPPIKTDTPNGKPQKQLLLEK